MVLKVGLEEHPAYLLSREQHSNKSYKIIRLIISNKLVLFTDCGVLNQNNEISTRNNDAVLK